MKIKGGCDATETKEISSVKIKEVAIITRVAESSSIIVLKVSIEYFSLKVIGLRIVTLIECVT